MTHLPELTEIKAKINKLDLIKLKSFCTMKETISKVKWQPSEWEKVKSVSRVWLFETPWTVAYQAPLSTGFSRQEYRSGLPLPSPGDLPDPRIELRSPTFQADTLTSESPGKPKVKVKSLSPIWLFATPWTAAYQAPPSTGFSRQEYWTRVLLPSP